MESSGPECIITEKLGVYISMYVQACTYLLTLYYILRRLWSGWIRDL